ncbi:metallophosphoesterase [Aureimonas sp. AU20]|uniref:metallophosphoesterase n=1 Tax=Aureimonas sp. AU20 TaxID=1349819 RepID=UPI00072291A9|nr:metallophosphoesterase [Aureimonas sp. AU20]ALN73067.1 hypothetical protein M673_10080 [Aureimonas sp. AU20]
MRNVRLWIQSDIHNDVVPYTLPRGVEADVAIVAGDVGGRLSGQARLWLEANAPEGMPMLVVAGNHDFYGASLDDEVDRVRRKTSMGDRIQVLDGYSTIIGGVRFVGATLWTDVNSYGDGYTSQRDFMAYMTDWRAIRWQGRKHTRHIRNFIDAHHRQMRAFESVLATPFDGPTVVITHHAPSARSLEDGKATKPLDAAYASYLEDLIHKHEPDLWVHGHVHHNLDYMIGRTRVVCNPRGYVMRHQSPRSLPTIENHAFNPGLVLDVAVDPRPRYEAASVDHASEHPDVFLSRVGPAIASTPADHAAWLREAAEVHDEDEPKGPSV